MISVPQCFSNVLWSNKAKKENQTSSFASAFYPDVRRGKKKKKKNQRKSATPRNKTKVNKSNNTLSGLMLVLSRFMCFSTCCVNPFCRPSSAACLFSGQRTRAGNNTASCGHKLWAKAIHLRGVFVRLKKWSGKLFLWRSPLLKICWSKTEGPAICWNSWCISLKGPAQ